MPSVPQPHQELDVCPPSSSAHAKCICSRKQCHEHIITLAPLPPSLCLSQQDYGGNCKQIKHCEQQKDLCHYTSPPHTSSCATSRSHSVRVCVSQTHPCINALNCSPPLQRSRSFSFQPLALPATVTLWLLSAEQQRLVPQYQPRHKAHSLLLRARIVTAMTPPPHPPIPDTQLSLFSSADLNWPFI